MADGSGSHPAIDEDHGTGSQRGYEAALKQLSVLAKLPTRIVAVRTERELREIVGEAIVELLGAVARFELFVAEGPNGTLVPAGDPHGGLTLLGLVLASGEAIGERATVLRAVKDVHGDVLSAPLSDRQAAMGVLIVEGPAGQRYHARDLDALHAVAAQISLSLQRLHIERRSSAHRRMQTDMVLAREVQRRFLPGALPPRARLRVTSHYRPAYDVGGDFYDLIPHHGGEAVTAVIGDVAGKGVAAALLMSRLTSDLRRLGPLSESPRTLLHELQRQLELDAPPDTFVTVACVRFEPDRGRVIVANAGHVPPIVRRTSGQVSLFGRASGPPLGVSDAQFYADEEIAIGTGDLVVLMTDGLVEALDRPGDRLGTRLLVQLIADAPHDIEAINQRILAQLERERLMRLVDDVTLVAIEVTPPRA